MSATAGQYQFRTSRRVVAVLAGGLCGAAAVAIWGLIAGRFDATSARLIGSALAATIATLFGLAGSTVLSCGPRRTVLGWATIATSGAALVLSLVLIWLNSAEDSDTVFRAFGVTLTATLACAEASLLLGWLRASDARAVVVLADAAVGAASVAALLLSGLLLFAEGRVAPWVWRSLGVLIVIAALATLLAPLMRKLGALRDSGTGSRTGEPSNGPR